MALSSPSKHRSSSPWRQGLLSFNRARDEIFEIGYTMTTIRLWCAVEMNSRANDRFDFRPIYEPHSLVPRILLEEGEKKIGEISKRSNLIDFDCNSTIISSFFSSSSFLRSELWDQVRFIRIHRCFRFHTVSNFH